MKKNIFKILIFTLILVLCLNYVDSMLRYKFYDGIYHLDKFYEQEESNVDVLVLGSSHAFGDVNPAILYRHYGIAAYDLCASGQALWNTYYYFKEALKTQKPKLVILEAYRVCETQEYMDDSRIIKSNFGLKLSKDKIDSIKVSTSKEKWTHFLTEWIHYHSRYESISKEDFYGYPSEGAGSIDAQNWKGFVNYLGTTECVEPSVDENVIEDLPEKSEVYYRKIIELAQENEIPLLIIVSPYSSYNQFEAGKYNMASKIAEEYGVPFINFNNSYEAMQLDFSTDFHDHSHLNYKGSEKYTSLLGEYIVKNYQIPDRRNEAEYYTWELNAQYYERTIESLAWKKIVDLSQYIERMEEYQQDYLYIVSLTGQYEDNENINQVQEFAGGEFMVFVKSEGEINYMEQKQEGYFHHIELDNSDLAVKGQLVADSTGVSVHEQSIVIDRVEQIKVKNGINIVVWDNFMGEVVDCVGFDAKNNYQAIR